MLVSKRRFLAAQEQVHRLQQELDEAHLSLTRYKEQERELVDAVVAARVEARAVRNRAEDEAGSVLDGARDEALTIKAEARAQLGAAQAEITRLRDVQRELSTSLEQSLETLRSVLTHTALPQPSRAAGDQAASEPARVPAMVPPESARLAPITAAREHRHAADQSVSPARDAARRDPERVTAAFPRFESFAANSSKDRRAVLALRLDRRSLLRAAGVAVVCVALIGGARWWRGSADRRPTPTGQATGPATAVSTAPASVGDVSGTSRAAAPRRGALPVGTSRVTVALSALRPVWLRAEVDGKEAVARLVRAGETLEFKGVNNVVFRAGDAGALLASVNGQARAPLGRDGAVLTKRFAADHPLLSTDARAARPPATPPTTQSPPATSAGPKSTLQRPPLPAVSTQLPLRQVEASSPGFVETAAHPPSAPPLASAQALPSAAPLASTDEADVLRAHETYFEALRRGDSGQISRLVADGFTASGAPAADDSGLPYPLSLRNASVEIRGVGAVVSGTAAQRITVSDGQASRDQQLLFSEVWVKRDGQWQLMNVRFVTPAGGR